MGCYNTTGFVSGLNVRCSDPIVAIPCIIVNGGKYSPNCYYTASQLRPISLPLFGKYDDYGSIEDIEDTPSARAWKMSVCDDIEGCMNIFERSNEYRTALSKILLHEKEYLYEHNYEEIRNGLLSALDADANICLIIEHRKVYEKLIADKNDKAKKFFNDWVSFRQKLISKKCGYFRCYFEGQPFKPMSLLELEFSVNYELTKEVELLSEESDKLDKKWGRYSLNNFFFAWQSGFYAYGKDGKNDGKSIFNIDGIADAFSDFSTFDRNIMKLNVGYRTASCNCGGQEDFNDNIIKFYGFLSDFYNEDLKDEYDEDEDEE